jgi:hypothetical protein
VKLKGEAKHWDIVGDSGNVKARAFCPTCGYAWDHLDPALPKFDKMPPM